MTLHDHVREATARLTAAGIAADEATRDADLLARHVLGWDHATWLMRRREPAPPGFATAYGEPVARRARREPIAYIRGVQEFWGRDFLVGPATLIPRPETEFIVEEALAWARERGRAAPVGILDVGAGSGCLAVTLALELPSARVAATDVSPDALDIARANASRLGATVAFHLGPLAAAAAVPVDLLVSNPPYIPEADIGGLQPEVREYEPRTALAAGADGLDVVRDLLREAPRIVAPGGRLLMEIGDGQAVAARRLVADAEGVELLRIRRDLRGVERVLVIDRTSAPTTSSE